MKTSRSNYVSRKDFTVTLATGLHVSLSLASHYLAIYVNAIAKVCLKRPLALLYHCPAI